MTQQEIQIQVWREKFMQEAMNCAAAFTEAALQRERADGLQKQLDELKAKNEKPANPPALAAVE